MDAFSFCRKGSLVATITSSLQAFDSFTRSLQNVMQALDLTIVTIQQLQQSADSNAKVAASFDLTKAAIADDEAEMKRAIEATTNAQEQLNQAIDNQPSPSLPQPPVPVPVPPSPAPALLQPVWETYSAPTVLPTGMERMQQEMESAKAMYNELQMAQQQLSNEDMRLLSPNAIADINTMKQRVVGLQEMLQQVETAQGKLYQSASPEAYDGMNASIEHIRGQLHEAIALQDHMNDAMKLGDLAAVNQAYLKLNGIISSTESEIGNNIQLQEKFNQSFENGTKSAGLLKRVVGAIGTAYSRFSKVKDFLVSSYEVANNRTHAEQRLQGTMGNMNGATQDGIDRVKERAVALEGSTVIGADVGISGQSQLAKYVYDPSNVAAMTEAMYNLATQTYGVNVAQEQMQKTADVLGKAMMGDVNAMSRNGFKADMFDAAQIKMLKFGTEAERAALVVQMIEGKLSGLAQAAANTPEGKVVKLRAAWDGVKETIGYGVQREAAMFADFLLAVIPTIQNVIVTAFNIAAAVVNGVFQAITAGWKYVEPFLIAAAVVYIPILIARLWAMVPALWAQVEPVLAQAAGWAMLNWPILLMIAILGILIYVLTEFGVSGEQIVGAVFGYFMLLFTNVRNQVAVWWNLFASFAEFFNNLFIDPVYAIEKLFYDLQMLFLEVNRNMIKGVEDFAGNFMTRILGAVNKALEGFNWLADGLNKVLGIDYFKKAELFDVNNIHAISEKITEMMNQLEKPVSDKDVVYKARMEQSGYKEAFDTGYSAGGKLLSKLDGMTKIFKPDVLTGLGAGEWDVQNIARVGEVGKIKDTVDISSEDLKLMRDLAEMKNIQNFVTLTPVVEVRTGDIRHEVDVNEVVQKIEVMMAEAITSTAEGIYAG